jgi:hypothetical protein
MHALTLRTLTCLSAIVFAFASNVAFAKTDAQQTEPRAPGCTYSGAVLDGYVCRPDGSFTFTFRTSDACILDTWFIDFGDGTREEGVNLQGEQTVSHQYTQPGAYQVTSGVTFDPARCRIPRTTLQQIVEVPDPAAVQTVSPGAWKVVGWSTVQTIDELDAASAMPRPPDGLVPSGGELSVCGAFALIAWLDYQDAMPGRDAYLGWMAYPNGVSTVIPRATDAAGKQLVWATPKNADGTQTAQPFGPPDGGTYVVGVTLATLPDVVLAAGGVQARCDATAGV